MTLSDDLKQLGVSPDQVLSVDGRPFAEKQQKSKVNRWAPYKSKWEQMYADELDAMKAAKEIIDWEHESIRLRIAPPRWVDGKCKQGAWYKGDFSLWLPGRRLRIVEIKGFRREAAIVRFKTVAGMYKWIEFVMLTRKAGKWERIM